MIVCYICFLCITGATKQDFLSRLQAVRNDNGEETEDDEIADDADEIAYDADEIAYDDAYEADDADDAYEADEADKADKADKSSS